MRNRVCDIDMTVIAILLKKRKFTSQVKYVLLPVPIYIKKQPHHPSSKQVAEELVFDLKATSNIRNFHNYV